MATAGQNNAIPGLARIQDLPRTLAARPEFAAAVTALASRQPASFDGAWGSSCALLAAALARSLSGPLIIIGAHPSQIDDLESDLGLFSSQPCRVFPALESLQPQGLIREEALGTRIRVLKHLLNPPLDSAQPPIVLTSIPSLMQPVPAPATIAASTRTFRVGDNVPLEAVRFWLVENHFHATTAVELPGEFSVRGGILDVFAPDWDVPVRIEFFDDQLESIRRFDGATQRSLAALDAIELTVVRSWNDNTDYLTSFLPANATIVLWEPDQIVAAASQYLERMQSTGPLHAVSEVLKRLKPFGIASAQSAPGSPETVHDALPFESVERFQGELARIKEELERAARDDHVVIVAATEAELHRLRELLSDSSLAASGRLLYAQGLLRNGFRCPTENLVLLTSQEIFHRAEVRRTAKRHLSKAIDSFLDLQPGDLVVHLSHGVGRYRGLKLLEKKDYALEHLEIEFDGGTKVFVPAAKIGLVQKYVGGSKSRPRLAKIGGQAWTRQKHAAESAVLDMAAELLDMQAARASRPGICFSPDSVWQREFDASFPYPETPDQLTAIKAIKDDMQSPRPMDRLLCGDVGFGKTEVCMRAAFKAVDNGYQVAVLVPTTILAEQHYKTFRDRMAEFPFDIARLSRFCTPQEEREILRKLSSGQIDIVIGTHRLASADIQFANLGLVIIDEEQRFGVEVKERLKSLRSTVDVLTMTATPIPRTLHMSLVGVRDIANLETAPEERVAVDTKVTRFQEEIVRQAILRELAREGQVYFVHNRVNDIDLLANRLRNLVPEAEIRVGHGQMHEEQLEKVMVDFIEHRFDLLLATTIVESGLDIPNANTIFIDEADRYGLADLHQLRGRVGRYKHRAYCYLLLERGKSITPNASRRLRAIEEFSDMGAGFALSMRDLEIRGAGNLLGAQQSGHIAAVGYELYCQLLENAVRSLKKLPPRLVLDVDIDLPGRAFLPDAYVFDLRTKIDVYRRIARIASDEELQQIADELRDRFGALPPPVQRMLQIAALRIDAAIWQIASIRLENEYLVFDYSNASRIHQLAQLTKGRLRVVDGDSAYLTVPAASRNPESILNLVKSVLRSTNAAR
ncbi:MAG: transcription-repair coupling factor [Planctomycetes bacterium]|nr:transcription-repair coupling factor [Planctomycetota bacterium]